LLCVGKLNSCLVVRTNESKTIDQICVLKWLVSQNPGRDSAHDDTLLNTELTEVDAYLKGAVKIRMQDKRAYKRAPKSTRGRCYHDLETEAQALNEKGQGSSSREGDHRDRIDILNAADTLFEFFLPADYSGPTTDKYWGAVFEIITVQCFLITSRSSRN